MAIRCVGRLYPNGPYPCAVGACARVGPHFLQVKWESGARSQTAALNGMWNLCDWRGFVGPGWESRSNWNYGPSGGVFINAYNWYDASEGHRFEVLVRVNQGFSQWQSLYRTLYMDCFPWEQWAPLASVPLDVSPVPVSDALNDIVILMRVGTYARIPANSCIV